MIIFIDESGIHKQTDHSTFALVYVAVDDGDALEGNIADIEKSLRLDDFHWTEHSWNVREKFIRSIRPLAFSVKIAIFKNPVYTPKAFEWALVHLLAEKHFSGLYIDGKKPQWVERQIKKTLRDKGISVRKVKTVRHQNARIMHVADAFAGLSRAYYDNPDGRAKRVWDIAQKKITTQLVGGQTGG